MILAAVFSKNSKSLQKGVFPRNDLFFWFLRPQNRGGGVLLPQFCPKKSKTLNFGLFLGIFASSGLVLQNSAAHQCTCLYRIFDRNSNFLWILWPQNRDGGVTPSRAFSQTIENPAIRPLLEYFCLLWGGAAEQCRTVIWREAIVRLGPHGPITPCG